MISKQVHGRVCIIGAGMAGLSAAYDLGKLGFEVILLEANEYVGGLARYISIDGRPTDLFYHFICKGDRDLLRLVQELGIVDSLKWRQARTGFFYQSKMYNFGLPTDLLRFSPVPLPQRIRFGLNVFWSRYRKDWQQLDRISASQWLATEIGQQGYEVIWEPLLRFKFGDYYDQISAAWIWHRIHRVATSRRRLWEHEHFGYLEGGSSTLIEAIASCLQEMPNVSLHTNAEVGEVEAADGHVTGVKLTGSRETIQCSYVISTIPLPVLLSITPDLHPDYRARLEQVDYLGVVCGLLKLNHRLTDYFWINIDDPSIPFNGVIEYSNLNARGGRDGYSIVYIPYYLRTSSPQFSYSTEALKGDFIRGLNKLNPRFNECWIDECIISRATYAQAICTVGFSELVPAAESPLNGLLITDSTQYYPEDRTVSAAIRQGRYVASIVRAAFMNKT
jgi:protoporphyrinogen oxidase